MTFFLYKFFHNETNDKTEKGLVYIPEDTSLWPESWTTIFYKNYNLFPKLVLPDVHGSIRELSSRRRSIRNLQESKPLTLAQLSYILKCGYGLQDSGTIAGREENRMVPSAGKRYPLELYMLLFKKTEEYAAGVYHYSMRDHALELVQYDSDLERQKPSFPGKKWLLAASGMICISGVFSRNIIKYGSRGYRYMLLEAGHVAQNVLLASAEQGVNMIPIGGVHEEAIEKVIGLGNSDERVLYVLYF